MSDIYNILFFVVLIFHQSNCIKISGQTTDKALNKENKNEFFLKESIFNQNPSTSTTYLLKYQNIARISFNISEGKFIQVNLHGLNCKFNLYFNGTLLKKINLDTYSIKMSSNFNDILIEPLMDKIKGKYRENYSTKVCSITINNYYLNDYPEAELNNVPREETYFYLEPKEYDVLKINYKLASVIEESYLGVSFHFNEKSNFSIYIHYQSGNNSSSKRQIICNSTTIFLNSTFLLYDNKTKNGGSLLVSIDNLEKRNILMKFIIKQRGIISMIEKNALNSGLVTKYGMHLFFFTEVSQGEEGELILHSKRFYGSLYGKIINETNLNEALNYDNYYPFSTSNLLEYNYNTLKLNFSYENTSMCINRCFLLITMELNRFLYNIPLIGFEFTILTRFWNYMDYSTPIIDIPFNEYLIGKFEKGSINHHYYSLSIPKDASKIIIQIEANYIEGYYEEGRIKINTLNHIGKAKNLNITNDQNVLSLEGLAGKTISFAFRAKSYYTDFFSYYYFRVLYLKENETLYYPIDSNFGNLCMPEKNEETGYYYCNLILNNNLNDLSRIFSISQTNLNEFYTIYITEVFKNNTMREFTNRFDYQSLVPSDDIDYYLFKFEFPNGELKNIISAFHADYEIIYPQIYSNQMFFYQHMYVNNFKFLENYIPYYRKVNVIFEYILFNIINNNQIFSGNTKGKPLSFTISKEYKLISFNTAFSYISSFMKLKYYKQIKDIEEIKSGEAFSKLINKKAFPLYFYVKIKNESYINICISFKINMQKPEIILNNYEFKGYILDENTINRKIKGEYIDLKSSFDGYYSNTLKIGYLQINQNIVNNKNYILIEIKSLDNNNFESDFLLDILAKEYNNEIFFLPANQYIYETFDLANNETLDKNEYYLNCKSGEEAIIDFSSRFDDINIEFDNSTTMNFNYSNNYGFKRYKAESNNEDVFFSIANPKKRKNVNYIIKFQCYSNRIINVGEKEYIYTFDENNKTVNITSENDEYATICISFNSINLTHNPDVNKTSIRFDIYAFLFNKNNASEENLNTASKLVDNKYLYKSNITYYYNTSNSEKFNLTFENISKSNNFIYEMQLQVIVVHSDCFLTYDYYYEHILIFKSQINLTNIGYNKNENNRKNIVWNIVIIIIVSILIILFIIFIIKYIRLKKNNTNLLQEKNSLFYSNVIKKNMLIQSQIFSDNDVDSETDFI